MTGTSPGPGRSHESVATPGRCSAVGGSSCQQRTAVSSSPTTSARVHISSNRSGGIVSGERCSFVGPAWPTSSSSHNRTSRSLSSLTGRCLGAEGHSVLFPQQLTQPPQGADVKDPDCLGGAA